MQLRCAGCGRAVTVTFRRWVRWHRSQIRDKGVFLHGAHCMYRYLDRELQRHVRN